MFFRRSTKPHLNDNAPPPELAVTSIAADSEFDGSLTASGEVRIDGCLRGSVNAKVCVVEANGTVEGEISGDEIIVRGRVTGPLRAYHVHLQSGSQVDGDVTSTTITVDGGACLNGSVRRNDDPFAQQPGPVTYGAERNRSSFLDSPLWTGAETNTQRPLTVIRPR